MRSPKATHRKKHTTAIWKKGGAARKTAQYASATLRLGSGNNLGLLIRQNESLEHLVRKQSPAPSNRQSLLVSGVEGVVEIESRWTARKREQMGVVVGIESQNPRPVAENATRAGHPRELR